MEGVDNVKEYYFEMILCYEGLGHILVKANDVIEAGTIVIEALTERGYFVSENDITEIRRTEITKVIE